MQRSVDLGKVDPKNISPKQEEVLYAFFISSEEKLFEKYEKYTHVEHHKSGTQTEYSFYFSQQLIKRARKIGYIGQRIEVLSQATLGKGGFGQVYQSDGVLILKDSHHILYKAKPRANKIQVHAKGDKTKTAVPGNQQGTTKPEYALSEFDLTSKTKHIHPKPIVFYDQNDQRLSCMTMRLLPGKNLKQVINDEDNNKYILNNEHRLDITIEILWAVLSQAHQNRLLHRDLKPENIIVDLIHNKVFIIDYHGAEFLDGDTPKPPHSSTALFQPIELFEGIEASEKVYSDKTDSYSLGKSLAEFWGAQFELATTYGEARQLAREDTKFSYDKFKGKGLVITNKIQSVLEQLSKAKASERLSIKDAISELELARMELYQAKEARKTKQQDSLNLENAYETALTIRQKWLKSTQTSSALKRILKSKMKDQNIMHPREFELFFKTLHIPTLYGCTSLKEALDKIEQAETCLAELQDIAKKVAFILNIEVQHLSRKDELRLDQLNKYIARARYFYGTLSDMTTLNTKLSNSLFDYDPLHPNTEFTSLNKVLKNLLNVVNIHHSSRNMRSVEFLKVKIIFSILDHISGLKNEKPSHSELKAIDIIADHLSNNYNHSTTLAQTIRSLPTTTPSLSLLFRHRATNLFDKVTSTIHDFLEQYPSPNLNLHSNRSSRNESMNDNNSSELSNSL